jgi:DNA-3-methyladenine glycosylase II
MAISSSAVSADKKKAYVSGLAAEIASGQLDLDKLNLEDVDSIRKRLVTIKGIGHWTVDIYLLSCLHKLDVFPLGDLALVKLKLSITRLKPVPISRSASGSLSRRSACRTGRTV